MKGEVRPGKFCNECRGETLEATGQKFRGHYTVYECPQCGRTYRVERQYLIWEEEIPEMGVDSTDGDTK